MGLSFPHPPTLNQRKVSTLVMSSASLALPWPWSYSDPKQAGRESQGPGPRSRMPGCCETADQSSHRCTSSLLLRSGCGKTTAIAALPLGDDFRAGVHREGEVCVTGPPPPVSPLLPPSPSSIRPKPPALSLRSLELL